MAGGEGSRLRPLTLNRPKPMVPIVNRPLMEHTLRLLARHGITDILVTVHYLADEIQSYFGDGSDFDVQLTYVLEDEPLGTAGAVKQAEALLAKEPFLVISGDALTDCDLTSAVNFHKEKKVQTTIILSRVEQPLDFGVVVTNTEDEVVRFVEKPSWSEVFSDTVNTGMYVIDPSVLSLMEAGKVYDWSNDIFPQMLEQGQTIAGYVMPEYWSDIGSLDQYRLAQEHALAAKVACEDYKPSSGIFIDRNASVDPHAILVPPVCIGRGTKIRRGARIGPYTVIGDNAIVEEGAVIERSTTWDSAYIGPDARIHSATLCSRVTVKKDTLIQEGAVIGDRCMLDVGCVIRSKVKMWPDKSIDRGSTLSMSLIWGNRWRGTLFRDLGVAGLSNIECTPDFACRLGSAFGSSLPRRAKVAVGRDSTRSSRMIKRAIVSSLLSVGCDVVDLHSVALPVARHYVRTGACDGAVHIRKYPGNIRVTLMEMMDARGAYISRNTERKVESAFYREDFVRVDPDDLGVIDSPSSIIDSYRAEFERELPPLEGGRRMRLVCDYGYGPMSSYLPAMLAKLGIETVALNAFNEARMAPRTPEQIERHIANLSQMVANLKYDLGVLFTDEAERMTAVDDKGMPLSGNELLATLCLLITQTNAECSFALSVAAPNKLEEFLTGRGASVLRTKADTRALTTSALDAGVNFCGDQKGGFIFPSFTPGFDAAFACGQLLSMLHRTEQSISQLRKELPPLTQAYDMARCVWEAKGVIMRSLSETLKEGERVELLDGVKIHRGDSWVLILPDSIEPQFHLFAEAASDEEAKLLVSEFSTQIQQMNQDFGKGFLS